MARKQFFHPFKPYDIQQQFMEAVYDCVERGQVGIFESPTGTGKSLSLICGSLTWLREHKRKVFDESIAAIQIDENEPEWMVEHSREARRREVRQLRADFEVRLESIRNREQKVRERQAKGEPPSKRRKQDTDVPLDATVEDDQFLLDDYESDSEDLHRRKDAGHYSSETTKLMERLGMLRNDGQSRSIEDDEDELKIFFCSRTHSQLSQFVGELQRVKLPPGLPPEPNQSKLDEELKHLTLGSRKNLCINPKVTKLANLTAINERCVELQQTSTASEQKCPFLPKKDSEDLILDFRDHALAKIRDIEDLAKVGSKLQICPYYASRSAIGPAEIVTLPYPLLLQKSAREALGISLKGHIVIIDEAHNLINAVEGIYSAQIMETQLIQARESLMIYLQKFRNRLKGSNRVYVTQVVRVIDSLLMPMADYKNAKESGGTIQPSKLLSGKGVDQINMSKLIRYINDSKLARKVEGYVAHLKESADGMVRSPMPEVPTLTHVQNFLMTLMNPSKEGRFFWSKEANSITVKHLVLDPSEHFRDIVEDARAVILAGGTMSPMDEYRRQLFPYLSSIQTLSCGHLISPDHLLVRTIASDQDGPLDFSFKGRSNPSSAMRIGRMVEELSKHVEGGLVVFFPSYGYLDQVTKKWQQDSLMDKLRKLRAVYCDSRTNSAEDIFKSYSETIHSDKRGAMLLSVIGGKLSEGINFSDNLGRCVLVVGLPFPNLDTPEWKAKMQYIDQNTAAKGEPQGGTSRDHAENVCMRSVNQAIGRVIRHKDDWASILLMDSRYSQDRIKGKLPGWIKKSFPSDVPGTSSRAQEVVGDVARFFAARSEV